MRVVVGYKDGHPIYREEGPARARPAGYGGTSIGFFTGTVVRPQPARAKLPRQPLAETRRKDRPICGALLGIIKEPCARMPGHTDSHRSKEAMENAAKARRSNRPLGGFRDAA